MFDAIGVVDAIQGPKVSDNIQMVYGLGDLSELIPPVLAPTFYASQGNASAAAVFAMLELSAPPDSAIEILFFENLTAINVSYAVLDASAITAGAAAWTADFSNRGSDLTPRTALLRGTGSPLPPGVAIPAGQTKNVAMPLFVASGKILVFAAATANIAISMNVVWREVPA